MIPETMRWEEGELPDGLVSSGALEIARVLGSMHAGEVLDVGTGKGDFIDAKLAYQNPQAIMDNLSVLGRITIMTKQLDMALSNDPITNGK